MTGSDNTAIGKIRRMAAGDSEEKIMQEWEKKFDSVALQRGKTIFSSAKVQQLQRNGTVIKAAVLGIGRQEVAITMQEDVPVRMKCQCPKAKGGSNCEHMAAVLYAVYGNTGLQEKPCSTEDDKKAGKERKEAEKRALEARQEIERRIAEREAEKAEKRAERKRRREEAERAAAAAKQAEAARQAEAEKKLAEEELLRAAEAAAKRAEAEAERRAAEEEAARKKEAKIQEAIARKKREKAEEQPEKQPEKQEDGMNMAGKNNKKKIEYQYFDLAKLRSSLSIPAGNWEKGRSLIAKGHLRLDKVVSGYMDNEDGMIVEAIGTGTYGKDDFGVSLAFSRDEVIRSKCACPECRKRYYGWYSTDNNCAYIAGLMLQLEAFLNENEVGDATDKRAMGVLHAFQAKHVKRVEAQTSSQEGSLGLELRLRRKNGILSAVFRIQAGKAFVIKDLIEFCAHVRNSETAGYGTSTEINHQLSNFNQRGKEWFSYINRVVQEEERLEQRIDEASDYYRRSRKCGSLELYGWRLDQLYQMMGKDTVEYEDKDTGGKGKAVLSCRETSPKISMQIRKSHIGKGKVFHGVDVSCRMPVFFQGVDYLYFIEGAGFCRTEQKPLEPLMPLVNLAEEGLLEFQVGRNKLSEFYYSVLPQLRDSLDIMEENPDEISSYLPPEVKFFFYLDAEEGNITCRIHAGYGDREVSVLDLMKEGEEAYYEPFRMEGREREVLHIAGLLFPFADLDKDELHCGRDEELMYEVLQRGTEELAELGEVQCTRKMLGMNVIRKVKVAVGVSVSSGLLNLDIQTEDISREDLLDVLNSYRLRKKFFRLKNGSFLNLEDKNLQMLGELMEALRLPPGEFVKGKMHLPVYRTLYLDKMLEENESVYSTRDSNFREMVKNFKTVKEADYEEPASLSRILRGYQITGYKWLRTLEEYRFGGILADDMGLGKTLQMIAVLLAGREEGRQGTSLIVSPASLVFNWGEEFLKFAPKLKVLLVTGNQEERRQKLENWQGYDVLVTSYDLLRRDISEYEDKQFTYEVIDEAQYIKNHTTAASKAVKVIKSNVKFALTGTPIENRLSELWSIFDYLMPGFLYRYEVFKKELETPIAKNGDKDAMKRLQKMVQPFILRRLKTDVLTELPDKLEENRYVRFEAAQQKVYDAQVVHMQNQIAKQGGEEFNKNKMQILAELMKLRQICCDPALCFENYSGESAKLESCLDLIESALDGGHKILLFSQFTSMLEILQRRLEAMDIPFYTITGATAKEKRLQLVKAFNDDDTPLFLISLKAGGVGLNLTGADVVIHYDPWWNLAVQNQATDRAYRIGQTKKVTVYKLIASHTVEEKIQKLQETKRDLADQVVSTGGGQLGAMSQEELLELLQV